MYTLMKIYLSENDQIEGRTAYGKIIEFLRENKIAGATAFRGIEGYGVHSKIHTSGILCLSVDLPVIIEVVDKDHKIKGIVPMLKDMIPNELITIQQIDVVSGEGI